MDPNSALRCAQDAIVDLIKEKGPSTGLEIRKDIDGDGVLVWRACRTSTRLEVRTLGQRYLRLDRHVDGYARLSPSILREFFTYSVVGLTGDPDPLDSRCREITARIHEISKFKFDLARDMVAEIMEELDEGATRDHRICFILAGDVVYNMAHDVPRPERSTGRLVKGSDIDLVVVVDDTVPESSIKRLDELIYRKKYRMLTSPSINEEVDYKIKRLGLIRDQARFDNFKHMVAVKILQEGLLLYGSEDLFHTVKTIIEENGLPGRLYELEVLARRLRNKAEESILNNLISEEELKNMHLFYSAEEFEEFE